MLAISLAQNFSVMNEVALGQGEVRKANLLAMSQE